MDVFVQAFLVYISSVATALVAVGARAAWESHSQRLQGILYIIHLRDDLVAHLHSGNAELLKGEMDELLNIRKHFGPNEDAISEIAMMRGAYLYATTTKRDQPGYEARLREFIDKILKAKNDRRLEAFVARSPFGVKQRS